MNIEQVINAVEDSLSSDQTRLMQASEQIMRYSQKYNEFLQVSLQIACDLALEVDNGVRTAMAIEFMRCLDTNINYLERTELTFLLTEIVPATAEVAQFSDYSIVNPLIDSFKLLFEQYVHKAQLYGQNAGQLFEQIFGSIFTAVDNSNVMKTEVALRCFVTYTRMLNSEIYAGPRDQACNYFYVNCLKNLLDYLVSLRTDVCNFASPAFINHTVQAVFALLDPRCVKDIYDNPCYFDIPEVISQLLNNFGLASQSIELQEAKECACEILLKYINHVRFVNNKYSHLQNGNFFLEEWEKKQEFIAEIIVREINACPGFNLFQDHKSLESIFILGYEFIDTPYEETFIHPAAAEIILQHAGELVENIFEMIINAANIRMEKFENEDLLVIDCLKPSIDFVKQVCVLDCEINYELQELAMNALNGFIENEMLEEDYEEQSNQAEIFVGILLIRRGLPSISQQVKTQLCLRSLENMQKLHPIVFEEASKLLIAVTVDEYEHDSQFVYKENTNIEQAWAAVNDVNLDCIPYIIDEMCEIYVSEAPGLFQCRMLSGILSRPVRQGILPPQRICDLLNKSLVIMLKTEDKAQSGGMVTFTKMALQHMRSDISNEFLCEFISEQPEIQELPMLIQQGAQFRGLVENTFNILTMCIDSLNEVSVSFENACIKLCESMLAVDFDLAQAVFAVLDLFYNKTFIADAQPSHFDVCLNGFCAVHTNEVLSEAMCYFYHLIPRHVELIFNAGLDSSNLFRLARTLANDPDIVTRGFGFILLASILDKYVSRYGASGLDKIMPAFIEILTQFYENITLFQQQIDPETKRYILFEMCFLYFVIIGVCESTNYKYQELTQFIQNSEISLCAMAFVAAWCMHDNEYRPSSAFRDTLVTYVCLSINTLLQCATQKTLLVTWPCLLIARYNIRALVDYAAMRVPELEFSVLEQTGYDMAVFGSIFSDVKSMSLVFAQIVDQKNLPFWNHTDSTFYGKLARKVGECADERSMYAQVLTGTKNLAVNVAKALEEQEESWQHLPEEFIEYIQTELNQIRAGDSQNLIGGFIDEFSGV